MIDSQQPDRGFDLTAGFGIVIYALSLLLALGGGLVISFIYLTFIDWGASGILYEIELILCVVGLIGLMVGLLFVRSKKPFLPKAAFVSSVALALLGAWVLASTIGRDGDLSQVSFGLMIPILLTLIGSYVSYLKLEQIAASVR